MSAKRNAPTAATVEASVQTGPEAIRAIHMWSVDQQSILRKGNVIFLPTFGLAKFKQTGWADLSRKTKEVVPELFQTETYFKRWRHTGPGAKER